MLYSTFLDDLLAIALRSQLHQGGKTLEGFFRPDGAFGTFGTKIDMAFLIGIVSERARKDLHRIRKIRNAFAHEPLSDTFDKSPVRDLALALTIPNWYQFHRKSEFVPSAKDMEKLSTPRGRFVISWKCFFIALAYIEPRTPPNAQF
jgi:hypothetical protein